MNSFWVFIAICGIIISFAQKNQAKQRRQASNSEPDQRSAQQQRAELERQIREIFGETPPREGSQTTSRPTTPTYTQTQSAPATIKPTKPAQKSAKPKASAPKAEAAKPQTTQPPTSATGENKPIEAIIEDFSMEKAVIYSEIIRPKWEEL